MLPHDSLICIYICIESLEYVNAMRHMEQGRAIWQPDIHISSSSRLVESLYKLGKSVARDRICIPLLRPVINADK